MGARAVVFEVSVPWGVYGRGAFWEGVDDGEVEERSEDCVKELFWEMVKHCVCGYIWEELSDEE